MIHFVYILGNGSRWKNNELRYSLRSLERNFLAEHDVWIVGDCPEWIKGVQHIACSDVGSNPIVNVSRKILFALENLPEEFVLMNDDLYVLRPIEAIPVLHGGPMKTSLNMPFNGLYAKAFRETYSVLKDLKIPEPLKYDRHVPFPMSKAGIKDLTVAWPSGRFLVKTVYGNLIHESGIYANDVKSRIPLKQSTFWSSTTTLNDDAKRFLIRSFPMRSLYERP